VDDLNALYQLRIFGLFDPEVTGVEEPKSARPSSGGILKTKFEDVGDTTIEEITLTRNDLS